MPQDSPLRKFIALQHDALLILGPRRLPPLPCPASSTNTSVSVVTSLGFGTLGYILYAEAAQKLRPDIVVGMGDVLFGHKPGVKRADKMGDRTLMWVQETLARIREKEDGTAGTAFFAPVLPIEAEQQSYYLDALKDELRNEVSGIAIYNTASIEAIPDGCRDLPRLHLEEIDNPYKLLDAIALGADIFTIPFIAGATDAGIGLDFSFPMKDQEPHADTPLPLGIDMWSPILATSTSPLSTECACYTCINHHQAFIQHLLNAKEMLAWVLLQIHNHHIIDNFFARVRQSIANGTFEDDCHCFKRHYIAELPAKTGQGPR